MLRWRSRGLLVTSVMVVGGALGAAVFVQRFAAIPPQQAERNLAGVCTSQYIPSVTGAKVILRQNAVVAATLVLGAATFGLRSAVQALRVGADTAEAGLRSYYATHSIVFVVAGLVPHGALELAAFAGFGIIGVALTEALISGVKERHWPSVPQFTVLLQILLLAAGLLLVSAVVEEFVTPICIKWAANC